MNNASGTFTITLTGVTTTVTGTAHWVRGPVGVILEIPTLAGLSNSTTGTLTGLPIEIRPGRAQTAAVARVRNAGTVASGAARVETDGTITLSPNLLFGAFSALLDKGIESMTISYHMKP